MDVGVVRQTTQLVYKSTWDNYVRGVLTWLTEVLIAKKI
jgi:hypothetical protein